MQAVEAEFVTLEAAIDRLARKMAAAGSRWVLDQKPHMTVPPFDGLYADGWRFIARAIIEDR